MDPYSYIIQSPHSSDKVTDRGKLLERLLPIADLAGKAILDVYASDFEVMKKRDASPVTQADQAAEVVILNALQALTPNIPVVSEEKASCGDIPRVGECFWLVDPLDGTREFIKRNGEFTVNIGLIEDRRAVLGVVYAPALGRLYAGAVGAEAFMIEGAMRKSITVRHPPDAGLTVVSSRSHGDVEALQEFLGSRRIAAQSSAGSSLKFCLVATGEADLYPRLGRTMEWDTAAGHAVLTAAGGRVATLANTALDLDYNKEGFANPHFVAMGRFDAS